MAYGADVVTIRRRKDVDAAESLEGLREVWFYSSVEISFFPFSNIESSCKLERESAEA